MLSHVLANYNYVIVIILMMTGLHVVFASRNLIKKLVGLSIFQTSVFLLYISIGKVAGGQPPILVESDHSVSGYDEHSQFLEIIQTAAGENSYILPGQSSDVIYSNPLPHVLILTAIVVGVATLAIGLSLVVRIREVYQTIEEDEIEVADHIYNLEGIEE